MILGTRKPWPRLSVKRSRFRGFAHLTVIGPARPPQAPAESHGNGGLLLFPAGAASSPPAQKVRNLIRRASRELTVERGRHCGDDHLALVQRYLDERHLATGTRHIFQQLPHYLAASSGSLVLSGPTRRRAVWPLLRWVISVPSVPLSSCSASGNPGWLRRAAPTSCLRDSWRRPTTAGRRS